MSWLTVRTPGRSPQWSGTEGARARGRGRAATGGTPPFDGHRRPWGSGGDLGDERRDDGREEARSFGGTAAEENRARIAAPRRHLGHVARRRECGHVAGSLGIRNRLRRALRMVASSAA